MESCQEGRERMDGWQQDWRGISAECVLAGAQGQGMH